MNRPEALYLGSFRTFWSKNGKTGRFSAGSNHAPKRKKDPMENWIGIGVWVVMGALIGLAMKALIKRPEATEGHTAILMVLGAFAAVVGGMLGVGIFSFEDPLALSVGGLAGAAFLAALFTYVYRWGVRGLI
jgi:hypothetical protein